MNAHKKKNVFVVVYTSLKQMLLAMRSELN